MRKHIFTLMAFAATLCACNKEQMIESEVIDPVVEPSAPLVFTATMEDAPESKATFDNTAKCASWELGDQISVNGAPFYSQSAGKSSFFSKATQEIRPTYIGSSDKGHFGNHKPSNLVDDDGIPTCWCAKDDQRTSIFGILYWMISVSTGRPTMLKTIKLWNANNTASYPNRVWKDIQVLGLLSSVGGDYTRIKAIYNLNLDANNSGLAGEIDIDATVPYDQYIITIFNNKGDDYMQMADMKFVVSYPDPESPYTAYFPAALYNDGQTVLPSVIPETWADGKFNMPMYAKSNTTDLQFKNLCGVLKITVKSDQIAAVKKIRVSSANKATSGEFTVNSDNAAVLVNPNAVDNTVTVVYDTAVPTTAEGTTFYVAVPAQTYQELKIDLSSDAAFTKSMTTKSATDISVSRNTIYPITFVNNSTPLLPAGALPGEFSVSSTKKVYFSKGNLQAKFNGLKYTWGFAEHQYDYVGDAPGNTTIDNQQSGKVVDLFGWSTSMTYYGINASQNYEDYRGDFIDWGKNIGDGNTWRTLSKDEWVYIFNSRVVNGGKGKGKSYSVNITYGGKRGVVLYPDNYTGSVLSGTITSLPEGVVFLPAAGYRKGSDFFAITGHSDDGVYWSSTTRTIDVAYNLRIHSYELTYLDQDLGHLYGCSVRLVTEIK